MKKQNYNISATMIDSTNTKPFWENYKPYFSNKHSKADIDITLSENGDLIFKNGKIANTFNDYFASIVEDMNLYHWQDKHFSISKDSDIIKNISQKYKNQLSIRSLKSDSHPTKKIFFICFNDSLSKVMKNTFYFILKALFVLKTFKFLS